MNTVQTLLVVTVFKGWALYQLDVNNGFLHGILDEEVFIALPTGFYNNDRAVGKAIYVRVLSQFMNAPTKDRLQAAHKVLRYLRSAPALQPLELSAYCDFLFFLGSQSQSSPKKTKKQTVISCTSAEAKY